MQPEISFAQELIACPSITPLSAGCLEIIAERLSKLNFHCETLRFADTDNLWATIGTGKPLFVFAGHVDVVPPGSLSDWLSPPFESEIRDGFLYGRGACDMKAALAAMCTACENFLSRKNIHGTIAFLLTSDEEGPALNGTKKVIAELANRGIYIDYCVIGEPSSENKVGDRIRVGRRGSLHGKLMIQGKQGHVANPALAKNPIHLSALTLHELAIEKWDDGNASFPPTTFQITNIHAGCGAANVIPAYLELLFNFRFGTALSIEEIKNRTKRILNKMGLSYELIWTVGSEPFLTKQGKLTQAVVKSIAAITGEQSELSTGGGTSDGRFIAPTGAEVVEIGLSNQTAHQINECVPINDIVILTQIYEEILNNLLDANSG